MDRRTFLKAAGLGSVTFAYGCNNTLDENLFALVVAPEDMVTGKATWYASTCAECPAGCGVLAKNREGRIIKLEGNPLHPINKGKLCIRGQSSLQAVYDPDRIKTPKLKSEGKYKDISFDQAIEVLKSKMDAAKDKGANRVRMLSCVTGDALFDVFTQSLNEYRSEAPLQFEPFAYDSLKEAHQILFSKPVLPSIKMDQADFILGFGADFLETWLSPVEYARKFKEMHNVSGQTNGAFVHIGPYMSLTAANADKFINVKPGDELTIALGIIRELLKSKNLSHLPNAFTNDLKSLTSGYRVDKITRETELTAEQYKSIIQKLNNSKSPLVLGGNGNGKPNTSLNLVVGLINLMLDKDLKLFDFNRRHSVENVASSRDVFEYLKNAAANPTDVFIFNQVNPLYSYPGLPELNNVLNKSDIFKVSFSNTWDETTSKADLVFPVKLALETWDTFSGTTDIVSTFQPAMGRLTNAPQIGDVFIEVTESLHDFDSYQHFLMSRFYPDQQKDDLKSWLKMIQIGGQFDGRNQERQSFAINLNAVSTLKQLVDESQSSAKDKLTFLAVPSIKYFDGRGANKPWLNEIPDPVTNIAWESMLMGHPNTLKANGFRQGDIIKVESGNKSIQAPLYSFSGIQENVLVMQAGLGHAAYGRFAKDNGANPYALIDSLVDSNSAVISSVTKIDRVRKLPKTDGSRSQYKRKIAVSLTEGQEDKHHAKKEGLTMDTFPLTLPIEEGYAHERDVYDFHPHEGYRWGMVIDLDKCVGCSACVAACYAENNVAVVGKEQLSAGREMSWLRIERYEDKNDKDRLIFFPMLCQHCDNAPCEAVCPVYAPYHGKEGLNNQIYNRCIGTRFCAQNCPYKVRRFNWFDWEFDEPLNLQLNPNVTVRMRGVMEKCSFCVQRIKEVHGYAKNENRKIRDGEIKPACAQTCPTNAITFGSFEDKNSEVYKLAKTDRAYQALGYLNTKPAVIYLKKNVKKV